VIQFKDNILDRVNCSESVTPVVVSSERKKVGREK